MLEKPTVENLLPGRHLFTQTETFASYVGKITRFSESESRVYYEGTDDETIYSDGVELFFHLDYVVAVSSDDADIQAVSLCRTRGWERLQQAHRENREELEALFAPGQPDKPIAE